MNKRRRAAIYTRVSSDEQIDNTSLAQQRERCVAFCDAQGWTQAEVYTDEGVSGAKTSRPSLDALMTACRAGQVDIVVVFKTDRFSRSRSHLFTVLEELKDLRVAFTSVTESFDTSTTAGDAMVGMLGVFAQMERSQMRERTRAGVNARVRAGGWGGGNAPPFGYKIVGVDALAHLEVDEREAAVVRTAVSLILDEGLSTLNAARRLNALSLTPRHALLWTSQNLRNALCRGQWDGRWTFGKTSPKGTVPEPIVVAVAAILDAGRAAALAAHLASTTLTRGRTGVHPLSGRLFCPCGAPMTGIARGDRANRRYRCRLGRHEPGRPFCDLPSVLGDQVDAAIWKIVVALLADPDLLMSLAKERLEMLSGAEEVGADMLCQADRAVVRTQTALVHAAARLASLDLDPATMQATVLKLREQHQEAVTNRAMLAGLQAETKQSRQRVVTAQELAEVAKNGLANADRTLQAKIFRLMDVRATILTHQPKIKVRVEGSVAHDLLLDGLSQDRLLDGVRRRVAPAVLASAGA